MTSPPLSHTLVSSPPSSQHEKPVLFLIPSFIWLEDSSKTVFSPQQRLDQTLQTLKSIKTHVPHCFRVVADASHLPFSFLRSLQSESELCLDVSTIPNRETFTQNKSAGEAFTLFHIISYLLSHSLPYEFDRVIKLGGRYELNDSFSIDQFPRSKLSFRLFSEPYYGIWVGTGCFCLGSGRDSLVYFQELMKQCMIEYCAHLLIDIEHFLFDHIEPSRIHICDKIGMTGTISATGELFHH